MEENVMIEDCCRERMNTLVLWNFAGTKYFERYREENVTGSNVLERFHCSKLVSVKGVKLGERIDCIFAIYFRYGVKLQAQCMRNKISSVQKTVKMREDLTMKKELVLIKREKVRSVFFIDYSEKKTKYFFAHQ